MLDASRNCPWRRRADYPVTAGKHIIFSPGGETVQREEVSSQSLITLSPALSLDGEGVSGWTVPIGSRKSTFSHRDAESVGICRDKSARFRRSLSAFASH